MYLSGIQTLILFATIGAVLFSITWLVAPAVHNRLKKRNSRLYQRYIRLFIEKEADKS